LRKRNRQGAHTANDKDEADNHIQVLWPPSSSQEDITTVQAFFFMKKEKNQEDAKTEYKEKSIFRHEIDYTKGAFIKLNHITVMTMDLFTAQQC
jgi:hypothetical protein